MDLAKTIVVSITFIISSKYFMFSLSHLNVTSFVIKGFIGLNFSTKLKINILIKLILQKNDCKDFLLDGGWIFLIDLILSILIEITFF
jgi:hypothetical protein